MRLSPPFLDSARKLLGWGHERRTLLVMRWVGAKGWALRGSLKVAANLTVDEHNGIFAKWKPYSRSAVPPGNANSARTVPTRRAAKKLIPESTAEETGEPHHARDRIRNPPPSAASLQKGLMIMGVRSLSEQRPEPWWAEKTERVFKAADILATFGAGSTIAGTSMI